MNIHDEELRRVGYLFLFIACLIVVTILLTYASYMCSVPLISATTTPPPDDHHTDTESNNQIRTITVRVEAAEPAGLDQSTANVCSYQQQSLLFSSKGKSSSCSCCPICLMDYRESDLLRMLPGCGHFFHVTCVDPWLRMNLTCPVCRRTPI